MKLYEVVFDEKEDKGVYALSCVESPAMEDLWLTLKEHPQEIQFSAVSEEKRLLLGAALIPNKKIYRNMDGEEFYITFSEDTIERVAHSFIKNGYQNNSSVDHEVKLEGVSVVESWVVQDPDNDKSNAFGKKYEKGTWVAMMKVDNDEAYQAAKSGRLNGFSIDGLFSLKQVELNKNEMSEKKAFFDGLKDDFKNFFAELKGEKAEVKMGQLKLKDGKTKIEFEGDKPEVERPVFLILEDGEKERVPEGKHELEDGSFLYVDANGLVASEPQEEEKPEIKEEAVMEMFQNFKAEMKREFEEMKKSYEAQLKEAKEENEKLEAKLSKEPAEAKIVKTELKNFEPKTREERLALSILEAKN